MSPRVSCLMLTYNKYPKSGHCLDEAVESFLRQDYPNKELVILNDAPGQVLRLIQSYPDVRLINLPYRTRTLGEKCNIAAALSTGDLLMRWDDDDISLPWRRSKTLEKRGEAAYWKPSHSWFMQSLVKISLMNGYMGACCITRKAFDLIQGYPFIGVGEDQAIERRLREHQQSVLVGKLTPQEAFYIYRWDRSSTHVSANGDDGYDKLGRHEIIPGDYWIRPHWRADYCQETQFRIRKFHAVPQGRPSDVANQLSRGSG